MPKQTVSMELRALRKQTNASPPPPPSGVTVREWFAGLALMNPELMRDIAPEDRAQEAVRLADDLLNALQTARVPEKIDAPTESEMGKWDRYVEAHSRATVPPPRRGGSSAFGPATLPPPAAVHFRRASDTLTQASAANKCDSPGRYSSFNTNTPEDV